MQEAVKRYDVVNIQGTQLSSPRRFNTGSVRIEGLQNEGWINPNLIRGAPEATPSTLRHVSFEHNRLPL